MDEQEVVTEVDLVRKLKEAKDRLDKSEAECKDAQKAFDEIETQLIEVMVAKDETSTSRYEGLGHVTMHTPRLYSSVLVNNQDELFKYLRSIGRGDLIKEQVHSGTLSTFIGECFDKGIVLPKFIGYYWKEKVQFYPDKKLKK
jgi:hypothetical protein